MTRRIIVVRPFQVYLYSYYTFINLIFTINLIVSGTVRILSTITPPYYCHTFPINYITRVSASECLGTQFLGYLFGHLPDHA